MSNWFRTYGFAEVLDGLFIGAYPLDAEDVDMLSYLEINRVLNLVEEEEYRSGERETIETAFAAFGIEEHRLKLIDYGRLPPEALETAVRLIVDWLDAGACTYLHCRAGWQRSAAVAAGVVALRNGVDIDEALTYIRGRKPSAEPLPQQREDLKRWWDERGGGTSPDGD